MNCSQLSRLSLFAVLGVLPACKSLHPSEEAVARGHFQAATRERSEAQDIVLPRGNALSQADYVRFALLKHPSVRAAYSEWKASVEAITPAKALPDPQLTFQADISNMVMSLMPGVMFDLMLPGKRAAMAREASMGGELSYRNYLNACARVADAVNKSLVEQAFLAEALRLKRGALGSATQTHQLLSAEYQTGAGMGTLENHLRSMSELERLKSDIEGLGERQTAEHVRFKAALGLASGEPDPEWPHPVLERTSLPSDGELWRRIQLYNTDLGRMRAMVEMAVSQEAVATQAGRPDFTAGLMTDVKQTPWMWRPTASMTLPVWRGKIQGLYEAAKARREAAQASLDAELLSMSAELARMLYMVQESDRMLRFIDQVALPSVRRTRSTAEAAAQSGMGRAAMISEAGSMEFSMLLERNAALRERELAVGELSLMSALLTRQSGLTHLAPLINHPCSS